MTMTTKTLAEAAAWLAGATRLHIEDQEARAAAWDAERAAGVLMGSTANGRRRERAFCVSLGNLEAAEAAVDDATTALEAPYAHAAAAMTAAERDALHAARTAEDGARGAYLAALDGRAVPADARTAMTAAARDALHATTLADQDAAHRAWVTAWDATNTATTRAAEDAALRAFSAAGDATNTAQAAYDTAWAAAMTALMADLD
jgi:hypothetical protein